ncbi:hypothetical protein LCGC14_0465570 [marine sediment metagenome]|uniref:Uncharacterized protein n=1 Tax=marine sediment metagenome TaxID=412755 RepID=A0A0F9VMI6_9ZZZZ
MGTKKCQVFSKNDEGSLMTWISISDKWNNQKIINYVQKLTADLEMNIMWIKIDGKYLIDNRIKKGNSP